MMAFNIVYQTLEDRDNPQEIEDGGPFICRRNSAWLGNGYYFWDYHIQLAHWWGEIAYNESPYIICEAFCDINPDKCWDLHNEGRHRDEFIQAYKVLIESGIAQGQEITVAQVIEYAKQNGFFNHEAIRVHGLNSARKNKNIDVGARLLFNSEKKAFYDLYPAIQICLISKRSLGLNEYKVIYPDHHREDYVF